MRIDESSIDYSDIPPITDFSTARKNPFAEKIKKHGYTIQIHYSPEDVARMTRQSIKDINDIEDMAWLDLDADEIAAFKKYRKYNVAKDALRELEPLFNAFLEYGAKHQDEANLLLSQHGYSFADVDLWKSAVANYFPTEVILKEMFHFCVKNGEAETNGAVFVKGDSIGRNIPEDRKLTRMKASEIKTLIMNHVCAFNDIHKNGDMVFASAKDSQPTSVTMGL